MSERPPFPPFTLETALTKVRLAEDAWNTQDPQRVALAYTQDSRWRNRTEFFTGRDAIVAFLHRKWARERDYRLIKELWGFRENRIAVRFAYESHDASARWFRSYGNEMWEFDENGLMRRREASINDLAIAEAERLLRWDGPRRRDDHRGPQRPWSVIPAVLFSRDQVIVLRPHVGRAFPVCPPACRISWAIVSGCEISETWLAFTSIVVAPMRFDMKRSRLGVDRMVLGGHCVPTRLRTPRRMRRFAGGQRSVEWSLHRVKHACLRGRYVAGEVAKKRRLGELARVARPNDARGGPRCREPFRQRGVIFTRVGCARRNVDERSNIGMNARFRDDCAGERMSDQYRRTVLLFENSLGRRYRVVECRQRVLNGPDVESCGLKPRNTSAPA
jgi:nuclear transport factor 2 (NTF2) superfamily protein